MSKRHHLYIEQITILNITLKSCSLMKNNMLKNLEKNNYEYEIINLNNQLGCIDYWLPRHKFKGQKFSNNKNQCWFLSDNKAILPLI